MKIRKLISVLFLTYILINTINAEVESPRNLEDTVILNFAENEDKSIIVFNTVDYQKWQNRIYAVNPGKGSYYWSFWNIWDKNKCSGTVRSVVYSPFSKRFYFMSAGGDEEGNNGIYTIETKYSQKVDKLKAIRGERIDGIGCFLVNKKGVWLLHDIAVPKGDEYWGEAELCQIEDENGPFSNNKLLKIKAIRATSWTRAENGTSENEDGRNHGYDISYLFQTTDNVLLIRDYDNRSWWCYNCINGDRIKYDTYDEAKASADKFEENYSYKLDRKKQHIDLLIICITIICFLTMALIILYISTKRKDYKYKTESVKEQNRKIFEIQEKERAKISRDIHDSVVQDIRVIRLETENLIVDEQSKSKQTKIEDIATDCIIKLRNICYNLTPAELTIHNKSESSKLELISIINSLVQQFSSRTHFPCVFKVEEGFEYPVLEKETTQNLFRVIQEALNNIEKHSYATQASIFIKEENEILQIYITDDGIGCNQEELQKKLQKKEHLGLRSMIDRMELIGGTVEFFTAQDDGMEVKISLPLENK